MNRTATLLLQAAAVSFGLAIAAGPAAAQGRAMIDCQLGSNASKPECLGRGKSGPQPLGHTSDVTPSARTNSAAPAAPGVTGSTATRGRAMIDCSLGSNASQPECLGRGKSGPQPLGHTSDVTPGARTK
jgi:hypothetical protein